LEHWSNAAASQMGLRRSIGLERGIPREAVVLARHIKKTRRHLLPAGPDLSGFMSDRIRSGK
jgi:hypothetical protein